MLLSLLLSCAPTERAGPPGEAPTWHAHVAPIVAEHCGACHVPGGVAPFALDTYAAAGPMAASMVASVESGAMPPFSAATTDECEPRFGFVDDIRLTDAEKATLRAWADAGAPEGDPATAAPLPAPADLFLTDADDELVVDTPYVTSGDRDEFRCFSLDPGLAEDQWLTGLQVVPGNAAVVHHVIVFSDPTGESAGLVGPDGTYECFGGSGVSGSALLGAWAPGAFPFEAPADTGIRVSAGSRIVMQVHYHPAGNVAEPDATGVQLRWADETPGREALLALLGNASSRWEGLLPGPNDRSGAEFRIPAGVADHTETIEYPIPAGTYTVFAAGAHMHYIGTDMLIEVDHASPRDDEPATECLVHTPRWDFDWQRAYAYDAPLDEVPTLRPGDTLRLRCTYDNTLGNPGTRIALDDAGLTEPVDVYLGEETLDEMCLGVFGIVL